LSEQSRISVTERVAWALLWLFVFSIPWEKTVAVPGVGTFARLLGLAAFAAGALAAIQRKSLRKPNAVLLLAAAFVAWVCLTYIWTIDPLATLGRIRTFVQLLGMLWLIWDLCSGAARQRLLIQAYVWGSAIGAASTFMRYAQDQQTYYRRYAAEGFEPNDFGLVMALSIPLAAYLALRSEGITRWAYRAIIVLAVSAVFLTASRTALITTFMGFSFFLLTLRGTGKEHKIAVATLAAFLVVGLLWLAPPASRTRLSTIPSEVTQGTLHNRTQIWKTGLKVFKSHPLIGVGAGSYPLAVRPWLGIPSIPGHQYVAHNTFLSVLVECGVIGFLPFALLLATLLVFVWSMPSTERALWAVMLLVWAAGVSTLTWEHYKPTWLIFALISTGWSQSFRSRNRPA
jgi:O-antigen ligase